MKQSIPMSDTKISIPTVLHNRLKEIAAERNMYFRVLVTRFLYVALDSYERKEHLDEDGVFRVKTMTQESGGTEVKREGEK